MFCGCEGSSSSSESSRSVMTIPAGRGRVCGCEFIEDEDGTDGAVRWGDEERGRSRSGSGSYHDGWPFILISRARESGTMGDMGSSTETVKGWSVPDTAVGTSSISIASGAEKGMDDVDTDADSGE